MLAETERAGVAYRRYQERSPAALSVLVGQSLRDLAYRGELSITIEGPFA